MCFTCKLSDSSALACLLAISQTHISNKAQNKAQSICMNIWLHLNLHYMATFRWNQHKILNIHQRAWRPMFFFISVDWYTSILPSLCHVNSGIALYSWCVLFRDKEKISNNLAKFLYASKFIQRGDEESKCYRNTWNNFLREYTMSEAKVYYEV